MFTSIFIANLGSIGMKPGYHHLYEWGNSPLFLMFGKVEEKVIVEDGAMTPARVLPVRFSFDERIEDGLTAQGGIDVLLSVLEDPEQWLGSPDGDDRPMVQTVTAEE